MTQYVTKLFIADDCAFEPKDPPVKMEVIAADMTPTGILNADGDMVYRVRDAVGFVRHKR